MRSYPRREATASKGIMGLCKRLEILDTYGQEFKWFVNGQKKTKSVLGIIASVILACFMFYYFYQRMMVMYGYKGTKILQTEQLDAIDVNFVLNDTSDFRIAFALTAYDGSTEVIEHASKA